MDDVRVALVGFGMAGREFHAPLISATEGMRIDLVVTANAERAAAVEQDLPGAQVVSGLDDLWTHSAEIDLVVLASVTQVHVEQAQAAVDRGIAVVVDKPLGLSAEQARPLVESAAAAGVPLTVFQNRRWDSEHLAARQVLGAGALGHVLRYEARYERWRPQPKQRWREQLSTDEGGGLLLDLQSHLVDGAIDLFGPVATVYGELAAVSTVGDDVTFLALGHASGVRSHLGATSLAGAPGPRTRILGTLGSFLIPDVTGDPTAFDEWRDADDRHRGWVVRGSEREPVPRPPGGWADFYVGVRDMVRDGAAPPVEPRDALAALEVLDAARHSAREGVPVRL